LFNKIRFHKRNLSDFFIRFLLNFNLNTASNQNLIIKTTQMSKFSLIRSLLLLFMLFCLCEIKAQGKGFQVLVTTENDFLAISNKDENYTGSIKIEAQFPELIKWLPFFKYKNPEESLTIQRFGIGGLAYTPQNLAATQPTGLMLPLCLLILVILRIILLMELYCRANLLLVLLVLHCRETLRLISMNTIGLDLHAMYQWVGIIKLGIMVLLF
jgi:hypothetical protein